MIFISKHCPILARQRGGTFIGVVVGLLVGLAIAVAVALFINRGPTPFSGRDSRPDRPGDSVVAPMSDPNRSMYGKTDLPQSLPERRQTGAPADSVNSDTIHSAPVTGSLAVPPSDPVIVRQPVPTPVSAAPAADGTYFLQVGAFRNHAEADASRARLALIGYESDISGVQSAEGVPLYRVRIGPFAKIEDLKRVRGELAANGVDSAVARNVR